MKNSFIQENWVDPRDYAAALADEEHVALLYSGMAPGRFSILAWGLDKRVESLDELEKNLSYNKGKFEDFWLGYLGYGLRTRFEKLEHSTESLLTLPDLLFMKFMNVAVFDHQSRSISTSSKLIAAKIKKLDGKAKEIKSNMTDAEYLQKVETILNKIGDGELYQCNLTRKFYGEFESKPDSLSLFTKLSEISPAPYSAYIRFGHKAIISASPEKFLTVENGIATTTPIKGTLSSSEPAVKLANSEKDKAENLMIVDLMRNDLSRSCDDVKVEKLFEVTSYANYHHMSSTISGKVRTNALDVAKSCFPPGSMTGAPKIQAIKLANELEKMERGVYSGAIGYFGGDGSCDLSVVIRTLIIDGDKFEFQVGGGIVADSIPEKELEETYVKAKAIFQSLGIMQPRELPSLQAHSA